MPIQATRHIWMNGKLVLWEEAKVHVLTHALHYGTGIFEGIRCYKTRKGPAVFRLREHIERFFASAKVYRMQIPYSAEELREAVKQLIKANGLEECYIRPIAFRGYGEMGLNPLGSPVEVCVAAWPWGTYLGEEGLRRGIRAKVSSYSRIPPTALPPNAKATGQYINSVLAKLEALEIGYDEAIMLDFRGFVAEGPGENLFLVKGSKLYTPPPHASILPGITRDTVIRIASDLGYEVIETDLTRGMLYAAEEVFFTGTAAEITPIRQIDDIVIPEPWPITRELQKVFFETVRGEREEYEGWLDYVK